MSMKKDSRIYVAGHTGLVGSAIMHELEYQGYTNILTATRHECDLISQQSVFNLFNDDSIEYVFLCAAKVGGIKMNDDNSYDSILENTLIQTNVISQCVKHNVKKLLFLGSSCIYPKHTEQPIKESALLTGELEPTNSAYAVAKISGIEMCKSANKQHGLNAISLMPTNLYGPNDNYNLETSHVLPALIKKIHNAKVNGDDTVTIWGDGTARREFMHSYDLARASVFLMNNYNSPEIINVGTGVDVTISELAEIIKVIVGYNGKFVYDTSKPNGTPRKVLDVSKLNSWGWYHKIGLYGGIEMTYASFLKEVE